MVARTVVVVARTVVVVAGAVATVVVISGVRIRMEVVVVDSDGRVVVVAKVDVLPTIRVLSGEFAKLKLSPVQVPPVGLSRPYAYML